MSEALCMTLPLRTKSLTNMREHRMARWRRGAKEREAVAALWRAGTHPGWRSGCAGRQLLPNERASVMIERIAPRRLDSDNLTSALKAVRDEIAAQLGVDDGSARVAWLYGQTRGLPGQYQVVVTVSFGAKP